MLPLLLVLVLAARAAAQPLAGQVQVAAVVSAPSSAFVLAANYTSGAQAAWPLMNSWRQGWQLYRDRIDSFGGFPIFQNNVQYNMRVNITFFNVLKASDNTTVQAAKMLAF